MSKTGDGRKNIAFFFTQNSIQNENFHLALQQKNLMPK